MEKFTGTIANINNKYVILNDKHFIKETNIVTSLLPNDLVEYVICDNKIIIEKIISREEQIIFGIVKNITNQNITLTFPDLPKFFSLEIPFQKGVSVYSVVIIKIELNNIHILYTYDSILNRKNDKELFINLYEEQSKLCKIIPNSYLSECYYTEDFKDLTHLNTFNVDPTESRDFDDAISIDEELNKIYVHIVDANEQIELLSDIDLNSFKHAFTLYLPEYVQNILPRELAEDRLSLIEGKERLVITVEFTINPSTLDIINHSIYRSKIIIKKRYNYDKFNSCLNEFSFLVKFYNKWKRTTFNIPHVKLNIDTNNGNMINYKLEDYFDDAHKIIETLMVLTNLTVSEHVGQLIPQRYHSKLKNEIEVNELTGNNMIDSILTIKKYKPAVYDSLNKGHFGLSLNSYTHFTSPIRRYFDVIIHRLLAGIKFNNIEEILAHVNKQELYIDKLSKKYNSLKFLSYFEKNLNKIWKGFVLSATPVGITVVLEENLFEIFIFETSKTFNLYDEVNIKVKSINWLNLNVKAIIV